jgi:hypothetical protein
VEHLKAAINSSLYERTCIEYKYNIPLYIIGDQVLISVEHLKSAIKALEVHSESDTGTCVTYIDIDSVYYAYN